ncbi:MBL fold metallo-hydrolase [Paenibacillus agricola]|uniref:MBL fold metallo-hydrolase n=1 Tax=Paenibacillus agricola TaxID=2716264 RepID=A0ABX0JGK1_9BACL|nr:MBL fold metallo-hydrolase [Paenibacillus agricola]NHN32966.1 MBL fold metallo-hydrolase [Paenibacillus agricola]
MQAYNYKVLIQGQLSTNKYRYPNEKKEIICSTTLIEGNGIRIIVDPGWRDEPLLEQLKQENLTTDQIDILYLTHMHADHIRSSRLFPNARLLAPAKELENWKHKISEADRDILERAEPVQGQIYEDIAIIETPGHTMGHTSVLFQSDGRRILVAADAVLCIEYYEHREVHVISEDMELAKQTIDRIKTLADFIIPGHDAPFEAF